MLEWLPRVVAWAAVGLKAKGRIIADDSRRSYIFRIIIAFAFDPTIAISNNKKKDD